MNTSTYHTTNGILRLVVFLFGCSGLLLNIIRLPWSTMMMMGQNSSKYLTTTRTVTTTTTNPQKIHPNSSSTSRLYGNLSCPFEWAKYSCIHQGRLLQAERGYEIAFQEWQKLLLHKTFLFTTQNHTTPRTTDERSPKLLLVGDSTMRQIFVAMGCFFWLRDEIHDYYVDWETSWPCHGTPNCVEKGIHSGFNIGHFTVGGKHAEQQPQQIIIEVFFLPIGGSLRFLQEGILLKWKKELHATRQITFSLKRNSPVYNLTKGDTIVYNVGLHVKDRTAIYKTLDEFGRALLSQGPDTRPRFVYMNTITQHFPSETGRYENSLIMPQDQYTCKANVSTNPLLDMEQSKIQAKVNVDLIFQPKDEEMGIYHIGGNDCTHYCMPGLPDVFALRLLSLLSTSVLSF